MKKILIIVSMVIMSIAIHATNKISLSSAVGQPTEEVQVDVLLENSDDIAAIEIKIPLDENMTYVDGSIEMNSARSNGHAISAGEVDKELRIYIYSFSLNSIVGNDGKLCSFKLKLKREPAVYNLQPNVVLSSATGSAIMAETVAGSVTISAPKLEIETKNIDFGHIPIRSSYEQSVVLRNVGTSVLSVSSVTIDDTDFAFNETAFDMAPGDSKYLTLQYAPVNWGAISRTITVVSDAMNGKQTASVVADPFSVNELHVAQVSGIADSIVAVPITMNNMEPIVAAQFSFKLPEALVYEGVEMSARATNHVAMGSMSNDTLTVIIYSPTNEALSGVDGEICRVKLRLDGKSGYYYLNPLNVLLSNIDMVNMTSATSQDRVQIKSPTLSSNATFTIPAAAITNVASGQYAIRNSGQAPMTIERVTFLAEGYRVVDELPIVVATGKTQNITIEYTPTKEGKYSTTMQVYTNDPDNRMKSVTVSGEIYEPNSLSLSGIIVDSKY
ncbi:MAG: choice-of-anchor D domain-containing protein, partial [Paludibacteraceae bacterium]|nr:choice-of-anchor D domain-containing protein [Paludibacteraceae bacterium]